MRYYCETNRLSINTVTNMNKIIINRGSFRLDEVVFQQGTTTIGRASDNSITLDDTAVSSHHAKIVTLFHTSYIEDLDSTNGTLLNGKPVQKRTLHSGDVISLGNHQLLFQSDHDSHKPSETSETMLLKGSEIKQKLNEFIQAQAQLDQRNAKQPAETSETVTSEDADAPEKSATPHGVTEHKTLSSFTLASQDSPSLDREKNRAWLEAKKPGQTEKPAVTVESNTQAKAADNPATHTESTDSDSSPQIIHNTASAIRGSGATAPSATSEPVSGIADAESRVKQNYVTADTAAPTADIANDPTISITKKPIAQSEKTIDIPSQKTMEIDIASEKTIDIAAAARAATQRYRGDNSGTYAPNGTMALNRSKSRNKLMPMIWLLIVAVLIGEVVYITYRSLG